MAISQRNPKSASATATEPNRVLLVIALVVFLFAIGATGYRIYDSHYQGSGSSEFGFCDFYNGVYYPSQAFLNRDNPYAEEVTENYPISRSVPFFSPLVFMLHAPLTLLPTKIAAVAFFALLVMLVLAISWLTLSILGIPFDASLFLLIAGCLTLTRPGHISIFNGYFTLELALGTLLALHFGKSRPWIATFGLLLASCKPTYALPLFFLMLCRGHWRPAVGGAFISGTIAVLGLGWVAENPTSLAEIMGIVSDAQNSHHQFPNLWPINTWTRLDVLAIVAKWANWQPSDNANLGVMLGVLLIPCATIAWLGKRTTATEKCELTQSGQNQHMSDTHHNAAGLVGLICMLAMLISIYHHFYDAIILCVPVVGLLMARKTVWNEVGWFHRWVLLALLIVPFANYASARGVIRQLNLEGIPFSLVTSLNGICLAVALIYSCVLVSFLALKSKPTDSN